MSNPSAQKPEVVHDGEPVFFRFSASLRVAGEGLDLDEISRTLGLISTHQHRKGEPHGQGSRRQDIWIYQAPVDREQPLEEHIMSLWDSVRPHISYLRDLKRKFHVDIFCGYRSNSPTAGFEVDHRCLGLFAELEVPFGVSVIIS